MPNSAEDLGFPAWVEIFAAVVLWFIGAVIIYGAFVFIELDGHPENWPAPARLAFVLAQFYWTYKLVEAAAEDDGDKE